MKTYLWIRCSGDGEVWVTPFATDDIKGCMAGCLGVPEADLAPYFFTSWPEPDPMYWRYDNLLVEVIGVVTP